MHLKIFLKNKQICPPAAKSMIKKKHERGETQPSDMEQESLEKLGRKRSVDSSCPRPRPPYRAVCKSHNSICGTV